MELEGVRGLAAIVVVIYHALIMFYPGIAYGKHPGLAPMQNMRFEDNLYGNPLNVFLSGGFAVALFFVLSGFVLSIAYFQTNKESIIKRLASKRYLRLMIPALVSVMLVWILLSLGLGANKQAVVDIAHSGSLDKIWVMTPNFFDALKEGTLLVYTQSGSGYNAVLWTMYYEFIGSFIVFITLLVFGASKYRWMAYIALGIATFGSWFFAVILGMILADAYHQNFLKRIAEKKVALYGLLGTGLLAGGYPILSPEGTFYQALRIPLLTDDQNTAIYLSIGALFVIITVLYLPLLNKVFSLPRISVLGRYTYSLYLTHTLVLYTVGASLFVYLAGNMGINRAALLSMALTVPFIVLATWLFEKYIDAPSVRFANYFSDICYGRKTLSLQEKRAQLKTYTFTSVVYFRQYVYMLRTRREDAE